MLREVENEIGPYFKSQKFETGERADRQDQTTLHTWSIWTGEG